MLLLFSALLIRLMLPLRRLFFFFSPLRHVMRQFRRYAAAPLF